MKDEIIIRGDFFHQTPPKSRLAIVDPPYGGVLDATYDKLDQSQLVWFLNRTMQAMDLCIKKRGSVLLFGGIGTPRMRPFFEFLSTVEKMFPNWTLYDVITWKKQRGYGSQYRYLFTREEIAWLVKGVRPIVFNKPYTKETHSAATKAKLKKAKHKPHNLKYKRRSNVWIDIKEIFGKRLMMEQKPEELIKVIVEAHSNEGEIILDPFGGSGTTGIVARSLKRKFWICENNDVRFRLMEDRLYPPKGKK